MFQVSIVSSVEPRGKSLEMATQSANKIGQIGAYSSSSLLSKIFSLQSDLEVLLLGTKSFLWDSFRLKWSLKAWSWVPRVQIYKVSFTENYSTEKSILVPDMASFIVVVFFRIFVYVFPTIAITCILISRSSKVVGQVKLDRHCHQLFDCILVVTRQCFHKGSYSGVVLIGICKNQCFL